MNRSKLLIVIAIFLSIGCGILFPNISNRKSYALDVLPQDTGNEIMVLDQQKLSVYQNPVEITKLYNKNQLIGVITDMKSLDETLDKVYKEDYEEKFPGTEVGLGEDVYFVKEQSYFEYENIDDEIMEYLVSENLFSILTNKIEFSNGAVIYVNSVEDFTNAREKYLLNFISKGTYDLLKMNQAPTALSSFGEQELSLQVLEEMTVSEGLASEEDIFMNETEILEFLSYGYGVTKQYYTVKEYDTVEGVATQARTGINTQQLIAINPGVLVSEDQVLTPGQKLNITYFDSPLTVVVVKERLVEEKIYPASTKYIRDDSLAAGKRIVEVKEVIGTRNVRYQDTYTNGVLTSGKEISSLTTIQAVQEVVRIGTKGGGNYNQFITGGEGKFWYPVKNPRITCRWGCYKGHQALDVQERYNVWGNCYAAAEGYVWSNSYDSLGGYYVILDHKNGLYTYYGHFREKSAVKVGQHIAKGQMIGKIGMTGVATGPHVHFEIWTDGKPYRGGRRLDPCKFLGC